MKKYINRNIEKRILEMSKSFPIILITGARQVGKTTLLNMTISNIYKNINIVSLDNLKLRTLAINEPELFLENYPSPLIIDEFQYAPDLLPYIKMIVDNNRLKELKTGKTNKTSYFLTGSQTFLSMKQVSESLAGRVGIINLYGLSLRELDEKPAKLFIPDIKELRKEKISKKTSSEIFSIILKGSYPEIYKSEIELNAYYDSYTKTYIERDIKDLIKVKDELKFLKFMTSLAARTGQELNLSEIAQDAEISVPTANEWLSILTATSLVYLLEPYTKNVIKRVVKRPKIYFMDTGLACYLTRFENTSVLENSFYAGAMFETFVVGEIIKSFANNGYDPRLHLYYYRDNTGKEIDLIINYQNKLYPIEIKKSKNPSSQSTKNFEILNSVHNNVAKGSVLCMASEIMPIDKNSYMIPIEYI